MTTLAQRVRGMGWRRVLLYAVLAVFAIFYLMPIYVLVVTSLKSFAEVNLYRMWDLPSGFYLESFTKAWFGSEAEGFRGLNVNFMNSVYLAIPATIISAMLGSVNGYVLTKWKFKGSDILFPLLLFGMFIPYQSVLIPLVKSLQWLTSVQNPMTHWALWELPAFRWIGQLLPIRFYGSITGLILVHVVYGIPITTLIFRNYYANVPNELIEAAKIDGATIFGIYSRVLFPLSLPGFVVVMIWQFTSIWNDFLFAVTITSNPQSQPVTVGLNNLAGSYIVEWNVQMAGALMAALPTLLVYVFLGRFFMRGLMAGSLKG
jgi:glucose/mannose transport system permease protein